MKYRNWKIPYTAPQPPEALLRAGYSPLLAVLLALRGYDDAVQARTFLSGGDQSVFDPMLLQDMDKAVARIRAAIERRVQHYNATAPAGSFQLSFSTGVAKYEGGSVEKFLVELDQRMYAEKRAFHAARDGHAVPEQGNAPSI